MTEAPAGAGHGQARPRRLDFLRLDDAPPPPLANKPAPRWAGLAVIAFGIAMAIAVIAHVPGLDGPYYWKWKYTRLWPVPLYTSFALAAAPLLIALALHELWRLPSIFVLIAAVLSAFGFRIAWMIVNAQTLDLTFLPYLVRHPHITSFYNDAQGLMNFPGWLAEFDQILIVLSAHSRNKPPGPILLCYAFIKTLGDSDRTAMIFGLTLAMLQSLSVLATWFLLRVLSRSPRASLYGAAYLAMCPGYLLCFPMFDSLYILLVAPLAAVWALTIERNHLALSVLTGLLLAITTLMTFNFLVIGFFMALYPFVATTGRRLNAMLLVVLKHAIVVILTFVLVNFLMYRVSGYNAVRTFEKALENQQFMLTLPTVMRPYPRTILFDLTDFALGSAWISFALAGLWIVAALRQAPRDRVTRIVLLCVAQFLIVALTALLPGETARVWNFLYPLLLLPVGLELARFAPRMRLGIYCTQWLVLAAVAQNMLFL